MLNAKKFGLAGGILWGVAMFVATLVSVMNGYATTFLTVISDLYPGYAITISGSVVGLVYGFIDGFVFCWLFAWLYNWLNGKGTQQQQQQAVNQ